MIFTALIVLMAIYPVMSKADDCQNYYIVAQDTNIKLDIRYDAAKKLKACLINTLANKSESAVAIQLSPEIKLAEDITADLQGKTEFMGQNFGVGFAVSFTNGTIVDDAAVVNGVVVAKSKRNKEARVLLEFHSLVACTNNGTNTDFGCGPFAALATTQADVIGGVGVGWLWSWRNKAKTDGSGFSIGVGAMLDNNVRRLADGFSVGTPPPTGETDVRYINESRNSYLLFLTNTF